jgi:hypothetical protein
MGKTGGLYAAALCAPRAVFSSGRNGCSAQKRVQRRMPVLSESACRPACWNVESRAHMQKTNKKRLI